MPESDPTPSSEDVEWFRVLKTLLALSEEERLLERGMRESLTSSVLEELGRIEQVKVESLELGLTHEESLIQQAIEASLREKAEKDRLAFQEEWAPLAIRVRAVLREAPVPDGVLLLQRELVDARAPVLEAAKTDHEAALALVPPVKELLPVAEAGLTQWRDAMTEVRLARAAQDRRLRDLDDSYHEVLALEEPLLRAAREAEQVDRPLERLDPIAASQALPAYVEAIDAVQEAVQQWRRRKDAFPLRRKYVTDRRSNLTGSPLDEATKGTLALADRLHEVDRLEDALAALDELSKEVRQHVRGLDARVETLVSRAEGLPGPLSGTGLAGASPPVAPATWADAILALSGAWKVVDAQALTDAFEKDIVKAEEALPRESRDLTDLAGVKKEHEALALRNASTARNSEQVRSAAMRMIGSDGKLVLDLGELSDFPFIEPNDLAHVRREIESSTGSELPQSQHAIRMLRKLQGDEELREALESIDAPPEQDSAAARMIRATLGLRSDIEVTDAHARQAALSALMSQIRQGSVGSCFATALATMVQRCHPKQLLEDFKDLFATGEIARTISGQVLKVKLDEDQVDSSLTKSVSVPRKDSPLGDDPGLQAGLYSVGVKPEHARAAIDRAARDLRWEDALQKAVSTLPKPPVTDEIGVALVKEALVILRAMDEPDVDKALRKAIADRNLALGSSPTDATGHDQALGRATSALAPFLDESASDARTARDVLKRAVELQGGDTEAWAAAQDAYLSQEDNKLMRAWEYTLASMTEHGGGSKGTMGRGAGTAFQAELARALDTLGGSFTPTQLNDHRQTIARLNHEFAKAYAKVESRYDATIAGPVAKDGSSSRGGFVLFFRDEKIQSEDQYSDLVEALVIEARDALAGTDHRDRAIALANAALPRTRLKPFRDKVMAAVGKPKKMKVPWALAAGGDTDFMQQIYWGQDGPMTTSSSSDWEATHAPITDGGGLLRFLGDSVKAVGSSISDLETDPDRMNKGMPLRAVGVHAVTLLPGAPIFQEIAKSTTHTPEQVIARFEQGEQARNEARLSRVLSEKEAKAMLIEEFAANGDRYHRQLQDRGEPMGTVQEMLTTIEWTRETLLARETSKGAEKALDLADFQTDDSVKIGNRLGVQATPAMKKQLKAQLLNGRPDADVVWNEVVLPLGSTATIKQITDAVAKAKVSADAVTKAALDSGLQPVPAPEERTRRLQMADPRMLAHVANQLFKGLSSQARRAAEDAIAEKVGHPPTTVKEFLDGAKQVPSALAESDGPFLTRLEDEATQRGEPLTELLRKSMVADLSSGDSDLSDALDVELVALLSDAPTVAEAAELLPQAMIKVRQKQASTSVGKSALTVPLDEEASKKAAKAFMDGYRDWYVESMRKGAMADPAPTDLPTFLERLKTTLEEDKAKRLESRLTTQLLSPEQAVLAKAELGPAIDKLLAGLKVTGDAATEVKAEALDKLGSGAHHPLAKVEKEVKAAITTKGGGLKLAERSDVAPLVTNAVAAASVPGPLREAVASRALGFLEMDLPVTAGDVRDAVDEAAQVEAIRAWIAEALETAGIPTGRRFAVSHQAILTLEKALPTNKKAVREEVIAQLNRQGFEDKVSAVSGVLSGTDTDPAPGKVSGTDLGKALAVLNDGVDDVVHARASKALPLPGAVFADTNWGDGETMTMFTMLVNPKTGAKEVWRVRSDGTAPSKPDQSTWVQGRTWRLFDDPSEYDGLG